MPGATRLLAADSRPEAVSRADVVLAANRKLDILLRLRNAGCLLVAETDRSGPVLPPSGGANSAFEGPDAAWALKQDSLIGHWA